MWGNNSLYLNNVHVEQQKKSLALHGSMTGFNGSTNNGVMQMKLKTLRINMLQKDQRLDRRI